MKTTSIILTVTTLLCSQCSTSDAFSIPDSFHLMQTAAASASHTVPHIDLLASYKQTLAQHPLPTKMMTGATLAVCGDAIAQSQDQTSDYDKRRAASFAVFDMAYRALQHVSFPIIVANCHGQYFDSVFPFLHDALAVNQMAAIEQTLASQLGIVPFLYYPAFFALTGAIQGLDMNAAIVRAQENFIPLMQRNLLFWLPVQFVQFGYIQEDLQIPFLSVCGLAWTFIISLAAGSAKSYSSSDDNSENADTTSGAAPSVAR
mmetsp:Transcript_23506/g.66516  ORF Transcript_23506/g.66516 Transcript_23506/m.66516 type:complete len:260 (-) Transcript_23506:157-936(-)|eukprot:CAMPEP_0119553180 /NCGR_PEP_ID=MMETSP1352-20130426/5985_1 /TAXON_ID=265584 /ORGANISM="Stauroneis constricta, Strain CCMP1120" /LENGTH=259 /DNA_ID=CAMNT_0007599535 /DNA_START=224 /DNA_END=1003 /DNA_ORIENTATION=+